MTKKADTLIKVKIHGSPDAFADVLIYEEDLARLQALGITPGDMVIHTIVRGGKRELKSPEVAWTVRGVRQNVPVSHVIHDIVGQNRRIRYQSTDGRVADRAFDLRPDTHTPPGPPGKKRNSGKKRRQAADKYRVEVVELHAAVCDGPSGKVMLATFETEEEAYAFLGRRLSGGA